MSSEPLQKLITKRNWFVERLLPAGTKSDLEKRVMDHYRKPFPTPSRRAAVAVLPGQIMEASFWLGELAHAVPRVLGSVPLLLAWGVHDFAFTPHFMDRFRRDFKRVTVRRLDASHYVPEDAPAELAEAIEEFLTGAAAAAA